MRKFRAVAGVTMAAAVSWAALANAQVAGADNQSESDEPAATEAPTEIPEELTQSRVMEEIEVVVGPQGQSQADPDLQDTESRIKWGYSPQAEQRMRREGDFMYDLPIDQTKPATLFRVEF
jgi:hypothetical protein